MTDISEDELAWLEQCDPIGKQGNLTRALIAEVRKLREKWRIVVDNEAVMEAEKAEAEAERDDLARQLAAGDALAAALETHRRGNTNLTFDAVYSALTEYRKVERAKEGA